MCLKFNTKEFKDVMVKGSVHLLDAITANNLGKNEKEADCLDNYLNEVVYPIINVAKQTTARYCSISLLATSARVISDDNSCDINIIFQPNTTATTYKRFKDGCQWFADVVKSLYSVCDLEKAFFVHAVINKSIGVVVIRANERNIYRALSDYIIAKEAEKYGY